MMTLEDLERRLVDAIRLRSASAPVPPRCVPVSSTLGTVRKTALVWRAFQLESQCPFTCRLLKRLGCLQAAMLDYFSFNPVWPDFEELSRNFLHSLRLDENALIRAVSQFELAALKAKAGRSEVFEILWDRDPDAVLSALQNDSALPPAETADRYRVRVDPRSWSIARES
jgi:hypothetical protein